MSGMLVGSEVGWVTALEGGMDGIAVSCALSDLAWWGVVCEGVLCMGGLVLLMVQLAALRRTPAVDRGETEGSTSMMLAKRRSA